MGLVYWLVIKTLSFRHLTYFAILYIDRYIILIARHPLSSSYLERSVKDYNVIIDVVNNICDIILVFLLIILILGGTAIIATEKGIESMMVETHIL